MEKRNAAEPRRTPCSFCGRPSDVVMDDKAYCKIHARMAKEGSRNPPLKDAAPSAVKEWTK